MIRIFWGPEWQDRWWTACLLASFAVIGVNAAFFGNGNYLAGLSLGICATLISYTITRTVVRGREHKRFMDEHAVWLEEMGRRHEEIAQKFRDDMEGYSRDS